MSRMTRDHERTLVRRRVSFSGLARAWSVAIVALAVLSACSSFATSVEELEDALSLTGEGQEQRLEWRREVERLPWYARGTVSRFVFHSVLGSDRTAVQLDNPSQWARERIELLSDWAGDSLERTAEATAILVPVVERDLAPLNRVFAIEEMATLLATMQGDLKQTFESALFRRSSDPRQAIARKTFDAFEPGQRQRLLADSSTGGAFTEAQRRGYVGAIRSLVDEPLLDWWDRRALLMDLNNAWQNEPDPELRQLTAASLRIATWHALVWGVTDRLKERGRASAPARRSAVAVLHRLGGPDIVPHLLALLEIPGSERLGNERFEDDALGQLQLVHLCGQLDLERALTTADLALLESRQGPAPVELLCEYALLEPTSDPTNRRMIARAALSVCLQREIEFDDAWVVDWYEQWANGEVRVPKGGMTDPPGEESGSPDRQDESGGESLAGVEERS